MLVSDRNQGIGEDTATTCEQISIGSSRAIARPTLVQPLRPRFRVLQTEACVVATIVVVTIDVQYLLS